MPPTNPSFANDIEPMFSRFAANMAWRFDLTDYAQVKNNAAMILSRIATPSDNRMPPPGFAPFTEDEVATFRTWVEQGCPP